MRRALAVVALLPTLMVGCNLGPDYRRPAIESPAAFPDAPRSDAIANLEWWEVFHDPALQELIRIALEENKDLQAAAWNVEQARAQLGFVKSRMWPSFTYDVGAQTLDPSDEVLGINQGRFDDYSAKAGVSWEIDLWGKFRRGNESARASLFATEWGRRALIVSLVAEVARGYFVLRDLDARLAISRSTFASRRDATNLIRERFNGGIVSELDVRQAEIQEAVAEAAIPSFRRDVVRTQNALSFLLGRNPSAIRRGLELVDQTMPAKPPVGLPSELLQRRPDVRQAEEQLHSLMAQIGVAQALRWPSLSLTGFLGLQSQDLSSFASGSTWSAGLNLAGPLFQFGRNKRRVEVARARTEQAMLGYEATVLDAFREVEDALISISTLRDEHDVRVKQVASASAARDLSRARYNGGVSSYLEVLESERSLFSSELEASRTLQLHYSAIVDLYAALGGGWDPDEVPTLPESKIPTGKDDDSK